MLELSSVTSLKWILVLDLHVFHPEVGYYQLPLTSGPFTCTAHLHIQAYKSFSVLNTKGHGLPEERWLSFRILWILFFWKGQTFHLHCFSIFTFISWPNVETVNTLVVPVWDLEKKMFFFCLTDHYWEAWSGSKHLFRKNYTFGNVHLSSINCWDFGLYLSPSNSVIWCTCGFSSPERGRLNSVLLSKVPMLEGCAECVAFHLHVIEDWHFEAKHLDTQHGFWIGQKREVNSPYQRK